MQAIKILKFSHFILLLSVVVSNNCYATCPFVSAIMNDDSISRLKTYEVIKAFSAPNSMVGDLTYKEGHLFIASLRTIFKIDTLDGRVIDSITFSHLGQISGLTFGNSYFWLAENSSDRDKVIYKADLTKAQLVDSFNLGKGNFTHGMEFLNNNLYVNRFYYDTSDTTVVLSQNGAIIDKLPNGLKYSHGIAFDGCSFWISSNIKKENYAQISRMTVNLEQTADSFKSIGGIYPNGLAWDGNYLWVANNESDSIYQIDISDCQNVSKVNSQEFKIEIFPNPTAEIITINSNGHQIVELSISDSEGRLVKKIKGNNSQMSIADLAEGLYILKISTSNSFTTKRIIKSN